MTTQTPTPSAQQETVLTDEIIESLNRLVDRDIARFGPKVAISVRADKLRALLAKLRAAPVALAEVMDALNWVDDFIARCNGNDVGACESANVLRRALASAPVASQASEAVADKRADDILTQVYDRFGIGVLARNPSTLMACLGNVIRRAHCLSQVEQVLSVPTPPEPEDDGVWGEESLLRWGADEKGYAEHFKAALAEWSRRASQNSESSVMVDMVPLAASLDRSMCGQRRLDDRYSLTHAVCPPKGSDLPALPLPPLPLVTYRHTVMGDLWDRLALNEYAVEHADAAVLADRRKHGHDNTPASDVDLEPHNANPSYGGDVDERAAFEAAMLKRYQNVERAPGPHGGYLDSRTGLAWRAWNDRAALAASKPVNEQQGGGNG